MFKWLCSCDISRRTMQFVDWFKYKKKCLNCMIVLLTVVVLVLIRLLFTLGNDFKKINASYNNSKISTIKVNKTRVVRRPFAWNTFGFHPVNEKGVYSFWNVCIEDQNSYVQRTTDYLGQKLNFSETKRIVVYDSFYRNGLQKLYVAGSYNSAWNHWDLHFTRQSIPSTHVFHNTTAFFVVQTCPVNFHHFWIDEYVPLFCAVRQSNKLQPGAENQIFYRVPVNLTEAYTQGCQDKKRFENVLMTLHTAPFHDVFYHFKTNSCFSSAVFGSSATIKNPRTIVDHVLKELNITEPLKSYSFVTIIQRTYRRILNARKLAKSIRLMGFRNTRIINLEKLTARDQARVAASSNVMIGVQGAGLQWAAFMPPGSSLIEIAWPTKFWGFYFKNYVAQYQIFHHELMTQNVHVNWKTYEHKVHNGSEVRLEERLQLLQSQPKSSSFDNIWKWADVYVDKDSLIRLLSTIDLGYSFQQQTTAKAIKWTNNGSYYI